MKKAILLLCCLSLLTVFGCGGENATPEDFGKNFIKQKFSGIDCDLDDLDITVTNEEENTATVNIEGEIQYEEWLEVAKKNNIPTFNDAAADVPPVENLWKYTKMGFDLVAFSGGKGLRGPQSAGLLLGTMGMSNSAWPERTRNFRSIQEFSKRH